MLQQIGDYTVHAESERFRIFPKNRHGQTVPVTRINHFIYLTHKSGVQVTLKRYLHMKNWYWRDSRDKGPCDEMHVVSEVSRMLGVSKDKAVDVILAGLAA